MLKKGNSTKRTFSFEIPKLKIGSSKTENNASTKPINFNDGYGLDSPPPTPKSVRPPLTPRTDHALRLACAYVLQDFKPSYQIYEEQHGRGWDDRPKLDYAAVQAAMFAAAETAPAPVINMRSQPAQFSIERAADEDVVLQSPKPNRMSAPQGLLNNGDKRVSNPRTEVLRGEAEPSSTSFSHSRSTSNPLRSASAPVDRPVTEPRSNSMQTNGSTPQTEAGEYAWNHSTAPTSVAITPSRNSVPNASQRLSATDSWSSQKFLASDTQWMVKELKRLKKAQEEALARKELEEQVLASLNFANEPNEGQADSASASQVPRRKPVPRSSSDSQQAYSMGQTNDIARSTSKRVPPVPQLDSRQSAELERSQSRKRKSAPRSESQSELEMLRPESRQSRRDKFANDESATPSRSTSTRGYFGSNSQTSVRPSAQLSREPSSRSFTRKFSDYVKTRSGTKAPYASVEISRPQSRDSNRSGVSTVSTDKRRSWKPFGRSQSEGNNNEASRPESALSKSHGRVASPDDAQSPSSKGKPAINLNRELPPLPSLDQWKPSVPETEKPKHIVTLASPGRGLCVRRAPTQPADIESPLSPQTDNRLSTDLVPPLSLPTSPAPKQEVFKEKRWSRSIADLAESVKKAASSTVVDKSATRYVPQRTPSAPASTQLNRKANSHSPNVVMNADGTLVSHAHTASFDQFNYPRKPINVYQNTYEVPSRSKTADAPVIARTKLSKKRWWSLGKSSKKEKNGGESADRCGTNDRMYLMDEGSTPPIPLYI